MSWMLRGRPPCAGLSRRLTPRSARRNSVRADRLQREGAAAVLEGELSVEEDDASHFAQLGVAIGAHRILQPLGRHDGRAGAGYGVRGRRRLLRSRLEPVGQIDVRHPLHQFGGSGGAQVAEAGHRNVLGGKAHQLGPVAGPRAAVLHDLESAILAQEEARGVVQHLPARELARASPSRPARSDRPPDRSRSSRPT